jgi:TolA-binding protein
MSNPNDHPENLGVRARRGALLSGEEAELNRLLEASPVLRMAHQLGRDFDQIAGVEAGDEQRVARFVERALEARRARHQRRFEPLRVSPWMAAAAVFAVCGVAFGLRGLWLPQPKITATTPSAPALTHHTGPVRELAGPRAAVEPGDETSAVTTQSNQNVAPQSLQVPLGVQAQPLNPANPVRTPGTPTALPTSEPIRTPSDDSQRKDSTATFSLDQPTESSAAALLRHANRARSAGQIERAIMLLEELQAKFGNSPEAHVSLVSLGKLLMLSGSLGQALQQFTSYLQRSGPLEEEALVGRAQALQRLGQIDDERNTWQRLLARFPSSVYVAAARERLAALSKSGAE